MTKVEKVNHDSKISLRFIPYFVQYGAPVLWHSDCTKYLPAAAYHQLWLSIFPFVSLTFSLSAEREKGAGRVEDSHCTCWKRRGGKKKRKTSIASPVRINRSVADNLPRTESLLCPYVLFNSKTFSVISLLSS